MKTTISLFTLVVFAAGSANGQTTFSFHDGSATIGSGQVFDGAEGQVSDTISGVTLTAEAFLDGTSAGTDFNGTTGRFGIDNPNTTTSGLDIGDRFDNLGGIESMVFSFDTGGTFDTIDLRYISDDNHEAVLSFSGGNTYQLNNTAALSGDDDFSIGETFTAGQAITLAISGSASAGQNFSLESFTITVPETAAYGLLLGLVGLTAVMIRRSK